MGREENIAVFRDTERLCRTNKRLKDSVARAAGAQKIILESDSLPEQKKDIYGGPARVVVSKKRSFEAAEGYKGCRTAVHNFASASNPGGGVERGAGAQEECLCRCSGLYFCLDTPAMMKGFYQPHRAAHDPLNNDDIIYTPGVTVFKTDTSAPELMPEGDWYDVDVITCAAPKLQPSGRHDSGGRRAVMKDSDLTALHEKRLRRILEAALSEGRDTVILGAFGCGAFGNNPEAVALANRNVVKDYLHAFRNIEYAVYCPPKDDWNYKVFARVLKPFCGPG